MNNQTDKKKIEKLSYKIKIFEIKMSDILLNYINNTIHLSKKIFNIELEFKNGVYFCELLEKVLNLKSFKYNKNPKKKSEILNNFEELKNNLRIIGISLNELMINEIIEGKNGAAAKLIYKIKIEMNRKQMNFDNVLSKINKNSLREKRINIDKDINKTSILIKNNKDEFLNTPSITSREKLSTFSNYFNKQKKNKKDNKIYNFHNLNNLVRLKPKFNSKQNKRIVNNKFKFPNIKIDEKNIPLNNTYQNISKKINNKDEEDILIEINEEIRNNDKDSLNSNYYLSTGFSNRQMKKTHSLYEYNNIFKNMKQDVFNNKAKSIKSNIDKIKYENLIKYSSFYNNAIKIGLNMDEIAPNIKKNAIVLQNDFLFSPNHITKHLKLFLSTKNEEKKIKLENLISPSSKNSFINEQKLLIKKSVLNMGNNEAKLFQNRFDKNSSIYKMLEYSKKFDDKKDNYNKRQIKDKNLFYMNNLQITNYSSEEINQYDLEEYLNNINFEKKIEKLKKNKEKENKDNMKQIIDLIIDMAELCYKSQIKLNDELINIPEYREWNNLFICGQSCLNIQIKRKNNISFVDKTNNSSLLNIKGENKKELIKKNENIINDDLLNLEFIDYLNYRGNWDINNFVNKDLYGKQMNIFSLLGNDIFKLIYISIDLIQNLKQFVNTKKILNNNEFELNEIELNNITVPLSNTNNNLFGEIISLNYDNISNEYTNNINNNINNEEEEQKNKLEEKNKIDFSYIPIKICFIGHSFSGRKTQAKLLCEKYKNLKSYSINEIVQFYLDEYKKIHLQKDQNIKNKSTKKNVVNENMEESEKYKDIFNLIENIPNFDINKIEELTQEKLSDDIKLDILIYQIKKDFPIESESEINNKMQDIIQKRQNLEKELKKLNEEQDNNNPDIDNNINKKESKKITNSQKKNNNSKTGNIQNINEELEKLNTESIIGFILYDYPTNYIQMMKLENIFTGYIQPIDKDIDIRDLQLYNLTNILDKPYINISSLNPDIYSFFNEQSLFNLKSFFNAYIFIDLSEEETIKRMNNRFQDPNTGIIYHTEYNPPNPTDKKLNERLIELKEPTNEKIKDLIYQFYSEFPNMLYAINIFKNYYKIEVTEKNEVFMKIENILLIEEKKYEDNENNDIMGNLEGNINNELDEKNEINKYIKRLKEIKKTLPKEFSEEIIKYWAEIQDKYKQKTKNFIKNYLEMKNKIVEQMNYYQDDFIDFLNNSSKKYKLVDIFYKKYNLILEKFPYLKNHHLVKEELENNISELSGNLWKLIQDRKINAITELDKIKNQKFIEQNLELFGNYIINLIIFETKLYINKINLIKKFYYEFEKPRLTELFPYEYNFKEEFILEDINKYQIFIPPNGQIIEKEGSDNDYTKKIISPRLNKIYLNCYKLFFYYDYEMNSLKDKLKKEYNDNKNNIQSQLSTTRIRKKYKSVKKKTLRESNSPEKNNNIKIINEEEELSLALNNEKIKYKIRLLFLKNYAEKKLEEIYNIGQKTFKDLDQYIIESVNSQNNAMNELMLKIKKQIKEGFFKLKIKDVELDIFDIYEKSNLNFENFKVDSLNIISEEDKKINYKDLYNIYLELKTYEIQDNYVSFNSFNDIVFKKYLFQIKSSAFMKYLHKIPFIYIYSFINKYIIKKNKRNSIIKLNEIFTILGLLNKIIIKKEQINDMMKNINDKLKYKNFIVKKDFMENKLWFEKEEKKSNKTGIKKVAKSIRSPSIVEGIFLENKLKENSSKEKKIKFRGSRIFPKLKFNMLNSSKENVKEISEEDKLKEYLFNINKNEEELIDIINFINIISIRKNYPKKKAKLHISNISEIKSNLDKDEILSVNSIVESIDKAEFSNKNINNEKNDGINSSNISNSKIIKFDKNKISKKSKIEEIIDTSDEKININFPEYTYFDYLIKK